MPVVFRTSQAENDLTEIALHIAEQNPEAADHWLDLINEKFRTLSRMPEREENGLIWRTVFEVWR